MQGIRDTIEREEAATSVGILHQRTAKLVHGSKVGGGVVTNHLSVRGSCFPPVPSISVLGMPSDWYLLVKCVPFVCVLHGHAQ